MGRPPFGQEPRQLLRQGGTIRERRRHVTASIAWKPPTEQFWQSGLIATVPFEASCGDCGKLYRGQIQLYKSDVDDVLEGRPIAIRLHGCQNRLGWMWVIAAFVPELEDRDAPVPFWRRCWRLVSRVVTSRSDVPIAGRQSSPVRGLPRVESEDSSRRIAS